MKCKYCDKNGTYSFGWLDSAGEWHDKHLICQEHAAFSILQQDFRCGLEQMRERMQLANCPVRHQQPSTPAANRPAFLWDEEIKSVAKELDGMRKDSTPSVGWEIEFDALPQSDLSTKDFIRNLLTKECSKTALVKDALAADREYSSYQKGRQSVLAEVKKILVDEMNGMRSEGEPTSRLTSAYNRIDSLN